MIKPSDFATKNLQAELDYVSREHGPGMAMLMEAEYYSRVNDVYHLHGGIIEFHRKIINGKLIPDSPITQDGFDCTLGDFVSPKWIKIVKDIDSK